MRNRGSSQRRPSVALVVSLIALFVALGGGATAASKVLFTGADIKNKSVTGKDIKNKTIGRKHLNNRALAMIDSSKTVAGAKGAKGTKGDRGPRGAKGKPGVNCFDTDKKLNTPEPGTVESCRGERGPRGPHGQQGRQGIDAVAPAGAVMFFDLAACPAGWSEFANAQGRAIVGQPSGGTLNGTSPGTPLGDLENRAHTHNVDPATVGTTSAGQHAHTINPPSTSTSTGHSHIWMQNVGVPGNGFTSGDGQVVAQHDIDLDAPPFVRIIGGPVPVPRDKSTARTPKEATTTTSTPSTHRRVEITPTT